MAEEHLGFYPNGFPKVPTVGCPVCLEDHDRLYGDEPRPWHVVATHFHLMQSDTYRLTGFCHEHLHHILQGLRAFLNRQPEAGVPDGG